MCNGPKFSENEERTGLGGGYNDRDQVEYIRREDSDSEYDDFGRKKKKFRSYDPHRKSTSSRGDRIRDRTRSRSKERTTNDKPRDRTSDRSPDDKTRIGSTVNLKQPNERHTRRSRSIDKHGGNHGSSRDRLDEKDKSSERQTKDNKLLSSSVTVSRYRERDRGNERSSSNNHHSRSTRDGDDRSRRKSDSTSRHKRDDYINRRTGHRDGHRDGHLDNGSQGRTHRGDNITNKSLNFEEMDTTESSDTVRRSRRDVNRKFLSERNSTNQGDYDDDEDSDDSDLSASNKNSHSDDNEEEPDDEDEDFSKYDLSDVVKVEQEKE